MDWITGIQRAIDYIEEHLCEDIDYDRVAAESASSSFYFQRVFGILCGYTLGEYIRMRRLTLAGEELSVSGARVIDVALKYGYDSPDSFAKAFYKFHGITPSAAREEGATLRSFSRLSIKISLEGGNTMDYRIEEKAAFYVLERVERHSVENGENNTSIPDFWDRACADGTLDRLAERSRDDLTFGICYGNDDKDDKSFDYSIAVRCDEGTDVPEGFGKRLIPTRTWLVFSCIGAMPDAIQQTWQRIVTEFLPTSAYRPTYEMDIEAYTDGDMTSPDCKSEIWVPVEKNNIPVESRIFY